MENEEIRTVLKTKEFDLYFASLDLRTRGKYDYAIQLMQTQKVVSENFLKKVQNTEFYEVCIYTGVNEHRIMFMAINNPNFMQATKVILLNSFLKKDKKRYLKEIEKARVIIKREEIL
ncbi:MAG: type II toxin-antitoxin system RelE/ParE family toxin [Paludibacter sp.]|nr:type II toxin-antitoxin system RelE/ParE family toxin [Paludibacter sp.]